MITKNKKPKEHEEPMRFQKASNTIIAQTNSRHFEKPRNAVGQYHDAPDTTHMSDAVPSPQYCPTTTMCVTTLLKRVNETSVSNVL